MTLPLTPLIFAFCVLSFVSSAVAGNGFRARCQDRDGRARTCRLNFTGTTLEIHQSAFDPAESIAYRDITRVTRIASAIAPPHNTTGAVAVPMPSGVPAPLASSAAVVTLPPSQTSTDESIFALYYVDSARQPHALLIKLSAADAPGLAAQFEALTGKSVQSAP